MKTIRERVELFEKLYQFDCDTMGYHKNFHWRTKYDIGESLSESIQDKTFSLLKGEITKTEFVEWLETLIPIELTLEYISINSK